MRIIIQLLYLYFIKQMVVLLTFIITSPQKRFSFLKSVFNFRRYSVGSRVSGKSNLGSSSPLEQTKSTKKINKHFPNILIGSKVFADEFSLFSPNVVFSTKYMGNGDTFKLPFRLQCLVVRHQQQNFYTIYSLHFCKYILFILSQQSVRIERLQFNI